VGQKWLGSDTSGIPFAGIRFIMSAMTKGRGERAPNSQGIETRSRRKRAVAPERNLAFVQAFADALRDILREERRRVAF
jgi:hypothetical protein